MDFEREVKTKYPHLSDIDIKTIVNRAKMIYYGAKYPCEPTASDQTRPIVTFFAQQWILTACDELIERLGFNSAVGYSENSVHWTFDGAQVSDRLMSLIVPNMGTL